MAINKDPENNETSVLHAMIDLNGRRVFEIGCGDGRLTWRYADRAREVTAIDPDAKAVKAARKSMPASVKDRVCFLESTMEEFTGSIKERKFDVAIFSWSL